MQCTLFFSTRGITCRTVCARLCQLRDDTTHALYALFINLAMLKAQIFVGCRRGLRLILSDVDRAYSFTLRGFSAWRLVATLPSVRVLDSSWRSKLISHGSACLPVVSHQGRNQREALPCLSAGHVISCGGKGHYGCLSRARVRKLEALS